MFSLRKINVLAKIQCDLWNSLALRCAVGRICGSLWCFAVLGCGAQSCAVVLYGVQWCSVVCSGTGLWCFVIYCGALVCSGVSSGAAQWGSEVSSHAGLFDMLFCILVTHRAHPVASYLNIFLGILFLSHWTSLPTSLSQIPKPHLVTTLELHPSTNQPFTTSM